MNVFFIVGEFLFIALVSIAIALGGPVDHFIDYPSMIVIVVGGLSMAFMGFTWPEIVQAHRHVFGGSGNQEELALSAYFWECMIRNLFIVGILGNTIGMVQMLSSLVEPELIGSAVAMGLLTVFYSFVLCAMFPIPAYYQIRKRLDK